MRLRHCPECGALLTSRNLGDEVGNGPLQLSIEMDSADWHTPAEAVTLVHPAGSVSNALCDTYLRIFSFSNFLY